MLLTAQEFEHAVSFTTLQPGGLEMAREHLVGGRPISTIAQERNCSRLAVHRAANQALKGWDDYRAYQGRAGQRRTATTKVEPE